MEVCSILVLHPGGFDHTFVFFIGDRHFGDRAAAETKWIFMVRISGGKPEPFYLGHYEDELVREKGWLA